MYVMRVSLCFRFTRTHAPIFLRVLPVRVSENRQYMFVRDSVMYTLEKKLRDIFTNQNCGFSNKCGKL